METYFYKSCSTINLDIFRHKKSLLTTMSAVETMLLLSMVIGRSTVESNEDAFSSEAPEDPCQLLSENKM